MGRQHLSSVPCPLGWTATSFPRMPCSLGSQVRVDHRLAGSLLCLALLCLSGPLAVCLCLSAVTSGYFFFNFFLGGWESLPPNALGPSLRNCSDLGLPESQLAHQRARAHSPHSAVFRKLTSPSVLVFSSLLGPLRGSQLRAASWPWHIAQWPSVRLTDTVHVISQVWWLAEGRASRQSSPPIFFLREKLSAWIGEAFPARAPPQSRVRELVEPGALCSCLSLSCLW